MPGSAGSGPPRCARRGGPRQLLRGTRGASARMKIEQTLNLPAMALDHRSELGALGHRHADPFHDHIADLVAAVVIDQAANRFSSGCGAPGEITAVETITNPASSRLPLTLNCSPPKSDSRAV